MRIRDGILELGFDYVGIGRAYGQPGVGRETVQFFGRRRNLPVSHLRRFFRCRKMPIAALAPGGQQAGSVGEVLRKSRRHLVCETSGHRVASEPGGRTCRRKFVVEGGNTCRVRGHCILCFVSCVSDCFDSLFGAGPLVFCRAQLLRRLETWALISRGSLSPKPFRSTACADCSRFLVSSCLDARPAALSEAVAAAVCASERCALAR